MGKNEWLKSARVAACAAAWATDGRLVFAGRKGWRRVRVWTEPRLGWRVVVDCRGCWRRFSGTVKKLDGNLFWTRESIWGERWMCGDHVKEEKRRKRRKK